MAALIRNSVMSTKPNPESNGATKESRLGYQWPKKQISMKEVTDAANWKKIKNAENQISFPGQS